MSKTIIEVEDGKVKVFVDDCELSGITELNLKVIATELPELDMKFCQPFITKNAE